MSFPIPESALKNHIAVVGMTGSGKSSTTRLIVEHVVAQGHRACIIDTMKSDWWGITSSATGKKAGLPFQILGGPYGHVPLHASAGKAIGEIVGNGKLPLSIVDMADFGPGDPQRFFVDFAQSLFKSAKGVVYLIIEEAHELAPKERAGFGAENLSIHWAKKLATGSRTKGIRLIVATQRVQALHNAVLGSCKTLVAHSLFLDADQKPVLDWAKNVSKSMAVTMQESLASLPTGTGWVCSATDGYFEKTKFPKFKTYDNTATPDSDGEDHAVTTAAVDLDKLREIMGSAVKEAEANDPKTLRAEIAKLKSERIHLEKQINEKPIPAIDPGAIEEAEKRGFDQAAAKLTVEHEKKLKGEMVAFLRALAGKVDEFYQTVIADLVKATQDLDVALGKEIVFQPTKMVLPLGPVGVGTPMKSLPAVKTSIAPKTPSQVKQTIIRSSDAGDGQFSVPQQKILRALAMWQSLGHGAPTRAMVAAASGYKPTGGGFRNLISSLTSAGAINSPASNHLSLAIAHEPMSREDGRAMLLEALSEPQRRIIGTLDGGLHRSREDVAAESGYLPTGGGFRNLLSSLATLSIIEKPSAGNVALADWARELIA